MAVGKAVTAETLNAATVGWLVQFDRIVNDPNLANLIDWWLARTVAAVKTDAPGFSSDNADDLKLGQMRGAVVKISEAKAAWNHASTGGRPLADDVWGLGGG